MTVWMDDWQMQCCGEPFAIGSQVAWTVEATTNDSFGRWLQAVLGADPGFTVDAIEDHHDQIPADTPKTRGTVTRILALRSRYESRPDREPPGRYPVDGSGTLTDVRSSDGSDGNEDGRQFMGYLIQLDT